MKKNIIVLLIAALAIIALAVLKYFAPVTVLNAVTPTGSYSLAKSVAYGDGDRQTLDIYTPDEKHALPDAPILLYIYGGAWSSGNKGIYKYVGEAFASAGYITVIADYRIYPEVIYPAFLQDTAEAIAYTAKRYPERPIVLLGHSAGAYNVVMVTVNDEYLSAAGVDRCAVIAGTIGLAGPYGAFPLKDEVLATIFPDRHQKLDAPLNHVNTPSPPIYLAIGTDDNDVTSAQSTIMRDKIIARGGSADFKLYPNLDHVDIIKYLSRYVDENADVKPDILSFLESHAAKKANYCQ